MKKLEDIPKKQIFEVPDGYFEKLPGIIQSRVATERREPSLWSVRSFGLRYALPAVILIAAGIFWFTRPQSDLTTENILASIQTQDLVAYLGEADFTTEELIEDADLDTEDALQIEGAVYEFPLDDAALEEIIDDID
jgi:hypothetical protein